MSAATALVTAAPLPEAVVRRNVSEAQWSTLTQSLYPGANPNSVLMVLDYCAARKLDPLKKPCHIVPMRVKDAKSGEYGWRDVVMPGIYEYRITAHRTGLYLGHTEPTFGPIVEVAGVKGPEWCAMTMRRWNPTYEQTTEFPVKVFLREVIATKNDGKANERWSKAPQQMLLKCTEAAGLREAFPEELGGEATVDEMDGQIDAPEIKVEAPQPAKRKSEQAAVIDVPAVTVEAEPTPSAVPYIGVIVQIHERPGGAIIELGTGFKAATRDAALLESARRAQASKTLVELVTKPSSDPTKYAPSLQEIQPVSEAGEV